MRIAITLTVEVDPKSWAELYDCEQDGVRQNVKDYVVNAVQQAAGIRDSEAEVAAR